MGVKDGVAHNTTSRERRGARDALGVAKVAANDGANKVTFVVSTGERAPGVQDNRNDGVLRWLAV